MSSRLGERFRPQVDEFEAREVPAALTWAPQYSSTDFYAASNWYVTGSTTRPLDGPMAGDDVTFDGSVSSADCTNLGVLVAPPGGGGVGGPGGIIIIPGPTVYPGLNSLSLVNAYAGTVSIVDELQVNALTLSAAATGAIAQPNGGASDLTVTGTFTWTSGMLNSSSNLSTVTLDGATGTIAPASFGTVATGSTLNFAGSSQTTIEAGTILLGNDATMNVDVLAGVFVDTSAANVNINAQPAAAPAVSKIDGTWTVDGGKTNTFPAGVQLTGTLKVQGKATLAITSGAATSVETVNNKGVVIIQNDSTLKVSNAVKITAGGALQTLALNLPNVLDQRNTPAIIDGSFQLTGGSVTLGTGQAMHTWSTLKVTGSGEWTGGTINLTIDKAANNKLFDSLTFTGSFTTQVTVQGGQPVAGSPAFALTPDGGLAPVGNQVWKPILSAAGGISSIGPLPTVSSSAGAGFSVAPEAPVNNKVLAWDIQN